MRRLRRSLVSATLWVASLSRCDNLFSRPQNRSSQPPVTPLFDAPPPLHIRQCPRFVRVHIFASRHHYRAPDRIDVLASLRCKWTQSVNISARGHTIRSLFFAIKHQSNKFAGDIQSGKFYFRELLSRNFWHFFRYPISLYSNHIEREIFFPENFRWEGTFYNQRIKVMIKLKWI